MFTAEMLVFCDESGTDRRDGSRRTGWSPKGVTPWSSSLLTQGHHFHLLPAITVDGLLNVLVYKGSTTKEGFILWLKDCLLPKMKPFPDRNSILVMDNASWHHDVVIQALYAAVRVLLWYLPPYSPDFNPIEAYFGDLKSYIRRQYQWEGGDKMPEADFREFLLESATIVGSRVNKIRGHYRQADALFRDGDKDVDYRKVYAEELYKFAATGTIE